MAVNEHGQSEPLQAENPIVAKMPFGEFDKTQNLKKNLSENKNSF